MDLLLVALAAAGLAVAGALGFAGGRRFGSEAAERRAAGTVEASRRAEALAESARLDALSVRAETEATRVDLETSRAEVEAARFELAARKARFEAKLAEAVEKRARAREKIGAVRARLDLRTRRAAAREGALSKAADVLDGLTAEVRARRDEVDALSARLRGLAETLERRQQAVAARERELEQMETRALEEAERLEQLVEAHRAKLERDAGVSRDEARARLAEEMTREAKIEAAALVKDTRDDAHRTAQREAQKVILKSIQRLAATTTIEHTVSSVPLASEDLKGRIIGREGRNIRSFEAETGIEVIVDDTPDAVLVSGFDAVRREIARQALVRLLADGRVHPSRIEEVVAEVRDEVEADILASGEAAVLELELHGIHPELVRMVGRMKYRSSYGQNLLAHSVETAKLASLMAAELGLDARKARRAGLLHDIGKVTEEDLEQPHAIVGMELCRRYNEHPDICNAVGAHHDEVPMAALIAPIVQSADAISGARPGARREALERYVERLKALEGLAESFEGVQQAYAIRAGRELRVIVDTDAVSDALADTLARDLSKRIEREMEYPGQIKVTVIREVRATATAR